jgi:hypothetical protein
VKLRSPTSVRHWPYSSKLTIYHTWPKQSDPCDFRSTTASTAAWTFTTHVRVPCEHLNLCINLAYRIVVRIGRLPCQFHYRAVSIPSVDKGTKRAVTGTIKYIPSITFMILKVPAILNRVRVSISVSSENFKISSDMSGRRSLFHLDLTWQNVYRYRRTHTPIASTLF